ncbi:MAG: phosphatidylethanolamine/phosphatidyl-N-methylethanolamine N-methyltransferase [Acetobacteraceae bacterium]|jgi:phosphatidylethanolamine/phosphatidyl-N-methylethanolamine N-methyltransferase|nr:class SAM-dependent methyltransferase [Rhodopila sp.]MEA2729362.1 phosphatidylethanolamine/phosphatidyl-N-methylethanolamine N-methyltransferase [Acetobacteraceae bacterium]MEA2768265.1 phosphatidylethanolamine/phosphatidyl-N-methylethanolamine N-methyltransferase [Acetobacteraceae bacterium]
MNQALQKQNPSAGAGRLVPVAALDQASIVEAYRRWAGVYDTVFGGISSKGRLRAVALVNRLPGKDVLEVGVGTGLALPHYNADKRITGIDLSKEMLRKARERTRKDALTNVRALHEMDAEATSFEDASFDIAVGMFVASVVPNPRRLLAEMRRLVRPGGDVLLVNHFAAAKGPRWWLERAMAPASRALGWHPDFAMDRIFSTEDVARIEAESVSRFGIFTLIRLRV